MPEKALEQDEMLASQLWEQEVFSGKAHTWYEVELPKVEWDGLIVSEGMQDVRMVVRCGVDGIVASNHGGRQMDGAVGSLAMLPEIVGAVGDKLTVTFDLGVRTGVDIIKAPSLGARMPRSAGTLE